jgi:accessory gene regulator protein AgrB
VVAQEPDTDAVGLTINIIEMQMVLAMIPILLLVVAQEPDADAMDAVLTEPRQNSMRRVRIVLLLLLLLLFLLNANMTRLYPPM